MTAMVLDEAAFEALTHRLRRELHVHCYRMLASFDEAEDAVQEALLRAWRQRDGLADGSNVRAWLYRITHQRLPGRPTSPPAARVGARFDGRIALAAAIPRPPAG